MSSRVSSAFTYGRNGGANDSVARWAERASAETLGSLDAPSRPGAHHGTIRTNTGAVPAPSGNPSGGAPAGPPSRHSASRGARTSAGRSTPSLNPLDVVGIAIADSVSRRSARSVRVPPARQSQPHPQSSSNVGLERLGRVGILPSVTTESAREGPTEQAPRSVDTLPVYAPRQAPPPYPFDAQSSGASATDNPLPSINTSGLVTPMGEAYLAARPTGSTSDTPGVRPDVVSSRAHGQFAHRVTLSDESVERIADQLVARRVGLVVGSRRQLGVVPEEVATSATHRRRQGAWVRRPSDTRLETALRAYKHGSQNVSYRKRE
ncbi:P4 [Setosphaeria turcica polymycovirus 1]|nr:P4 [Setosphaeria turcica polymycovirus 1]